MKIITKDINSLHENDYNPNVFDDIKYKGLVENIKTFGYIQPVLIDSKDVIIDGAHRIKACKEAGINKIQCVVYEGNTDIKEYRKLLTLSMNNLRGINNQEGFEKVIKELAYDMDYEELEGLTGFDVNEIVDIAQDIKRKPIEDEIKPYNKIHILISFHPDKYIEIQNYIDEINKIQDIEIEKSAN